MKVDFKKNAGFSVPDELLTVSEEMQTLKKAFHSLTPGRQRVYIMYFSAVNNLQLTLQE